MVQRDAPVPAAAAGWPSSSVGALPPASAPADPRPSAPPALARGAHSTWSPQHVEPTARVTTALRAALAPGVTAGEIGVATKSVNAARTTAALG